MLYIICHYENNFVLSFVIHIIMKKLHINMLHIIYCIRYVRIVYVLHVVIALDITLLYPEEGFAKYFRCLIIMYTTASRIAYLYS